MRTTWEPRITASKRIIWIIILQCVHDFLFKPKTAHIACPLPYQACVNACVGVGARHGSDK